MPVHHVHVDHRAAAPLGRGNLLGQVGEIRRKYRWQQFNHAFCVHLLAGSVYQRGGAGNDVASFLQLCQHHSVLFLDYPNLLFELSLVAVGCAIISLKSKLRYPEETD